MKSDLKPANTEARAMLRKLEALAERGVDGEKFAAQRKIARLKARFDFAAPGPAETLDLFRGPFKRSSKARCIYSFTPSESDVANQVKWAIETATGIHCLYRDCDLLAEASPSTANRLVGIAEHISQNFRALVAKFGALNGVSVADRGVFVMGLYDGMMNDLRDTGQPLPRRPGLKEEGPGEEACRHSRYGSARPSLYIGGGSWETNSLFRTVAGSCRRIGSSYAATFGRRS